MQNKSYIILKNMKKKLDKGSVVWENVFTIKYKPLTEEPKNEEDQSERKGKGW